MNEGDLSRGKSQRRNTGGSGVGFWGIPVLVELR